MEFKIKDDSGAFQDYLKDIMKKDVNKYLKFKKTLIYLPAGTNNIVAEKLLPLVKRRVKTATLGKAKSGNYFFKVEYRKPKVTVDSQDA